MRTMAPPPTLTRWTAALAVLMVLLAGCDDGIPELLQTADFPSPDGQWVATREVVHNGLGLGAGAVFYEIHVHRPREPVGEHGDPGATVVFYTSDEGRLPHVSWSDGTHLLIEYERIIVNGVAAWPPRHSAHHGEVAIAYRPLPLPPNANPAAPEWESSPGVQGRH
jgi:hypothetical protein